MINDLTPEQKTELEKHFAKLGNPALTSLVAQAGLINSPTETRLHDFVTNNEELIKVKNQIRKLAPLPYPVLILGETGTGKELLAQALHGTRRGQFCGINLTTLPDLLIESELFGHVKGAFTGATDDKIGLLEYCADGTIFLDEIGDMPFTAQAKLLRAIQEKRIRPVGSNKEREISCRFVCATHHKISELFDAGTFRKDLYYRISVCIVETLPLREHLEDIPEIVDFFCEKEFRGVVIPQEVLDLWTAQQWPGNVRELWATLVSYLIEKGKI
jgi:transcriptional regulator with PAS, ATPase and Fis domain